MPAFLSACIRDVEKMGLLLMVDKDDITWVITDPHWFTNEVLGKLIDAATNPFKKVEFSAMTTLAVADIEHMVGCKKHFDNDPEIAPMVFHLMTLS